MRKTKDNKKADKKGLVLKKETLRQLDQDELQDVAGGRVPTCPICPTQK